MVGSGPNGLAAGITLLQQGKTVLLLERNPTIGGGMRTAELTLPGFKHVVCSAVHPMAVASPFFSSFNWASFGLNFIQPPACAAHPLDNGKAAMLFTSIKETASQLGSDSAVQKVF